MKIGFAAGAILLGTALAATATTASRAADEIKSGRWQFTTQMQMPGAQQQPLAAQPQPGANPGVSHTECISSANPVPAETQQGRLQCKRDRMERRGGTVTWSTTCTGPQGPPIRSDGVAQYTGDRMDGTVTTHVFGPDGKPVDNPGRITGRYLGPCGAR
jgi:hypothetical protein